MEDQPDISSLAEKWLNGTITPAEKQQFEDWYNRQPGLSIEWLKDETADELRKKIFLSIISRLETTPAIPEEAPVIDMPRRSKWRQRVSVAAAVLMLLGSTVIYFYISNNKTTTRQMPVAGISTGAIMTGKTKATLTLSDGTVIQLDSMKTDQIVLQGSTSVYKNEDGEIVYEPGSNETGELYNTLTIPRGSGLSSVMLSDGSKVWLNVESTLRFPVAFSSKERKVRVTGEAYFEVSKDASRKFLVETEGATTEVLGTHFNVNTYEKPEEVLVTLLEGAVRVSNPAAQEQLLQPGQQAEVKPVGIILLNKMPDLEAVMAWKHGLFKMDNSDVHTVMAQLARWYDVEVRFEKDLEDIRFSGTISRNTDLAKVLEMLSMTKEVRFRQEGEKIVVYPF
ncbi:FecR domain-containing protein [Chitinophaga defluvii]|uniref:FecR domain-containing protein n=1 Tax=Chitinophaga defluvii TaxID=3163343 RepID=A0ABV2T063_9BACT